MNFELSNHLLHFGFPSPQTLAVFFFQPVTSSLGWQRCRLRPNRSGWKFPVDLDVSRIGKSGHFSQLCYFIGRQKTEFAKYCCVNKNERRIVTHSLEAYFNFNSSWWALGKRVGDTVVYATLQNILTRYSTFKFRSWNILLPSKPLERQKNCCCAFFAVLTLNHTKMWNK